MMLFGSRTPFGIGTVWDYIMIGWGTGVSFFLGPIDVPIVD